MKKSLISFVLVLSLFAALLLQIPSIASAGLGDFTFDPITDEYTFEISEDGNYYILTGVPKKTVEIVVPDEYEGKPVMGIANDAFQRAYAYGETFILSENIFYFDTMVFANAKKLQFNEYENGKYLGTKDNPYYALVGVADKTVTEFVLHDNTAIIIDYALLGVEELKKLTLSPNLKYMGPSALTNRSIHWNDIQADLEYTEYNNCYYLGTAENPYHAMIKLSNADVTSVELHPDTKVIHPGAFKMYQCNENKSDTSVEYAETLETVTIPKSVITIGPWAFHGCLTLKTINFEAESIDDLALFDMRGMPENVTLNWNYGNESYPEENTSDSISQSSDNDESDNNYIWIIVGISAVAVISAVVVILKKRK